MSRSRTQEPASAFLRGAAGLSSIPSRRAGRSCRRQSELPAPGNYDIRIHGRPALDILAEGYGRDLLREMADAAAAGRSERAEAITRLRDETRGNEVRMSEMVGGTEVVRNSRGALTAPAPDRAATDIALGLPPRPRRRLRPDLPAGGPVRENRSEPEPRKRTADGPPPPEARRASRVPGRHPDRPGPGRPGGPDGGKDRPRRGRVPGPLGGGAHLRGGGPPLGPGIRGDERGSLPSSKCAGPRGRRGRSRWSPAIRESSGPSPAA